MNDKYIMAFDSIFSTNPMQLLKILLPYIPGNYQPYVAILIKVEELKYTYQYLSNHPSKILNDDSEIPFPQKINTILSEICPYCPAEYVEYLEQIKSIFQLLEQYKELEPLLHMLQNKENPDLSSILFGNTKQETTQYNDILHDIFEDL